MRLAHAIALIALTAVTSTVHAEDSARARFNWITNCQGCHQADASGTANSVPNMLGQVSRFLDVEGGREYLGRVPGVAFAPLSDADLAAVLNWSLKTFDPGNLPADFDAYTALEVGQLRASVLVLDAESKRRELLMKMENP